MISFIFSIVSMFVGFIFMPLLNNSDFMTLQARLLLVETYPVLMIFIPGLVLMGGMVIISGRLRLREN